MGIGKMFVGYDRSAEALEANKLKLTELVLSNPETYVFDDLSLDIALIAKDLKWSKEKVMKVYEEIVMELYEDSQRYEKSFKFRFFRKLCEKKENEMLKAADDMVAAWKTKPK